MIYQIVDDAMLKQNRTDGTGWDWCWADWQRDWMDATPQSVRLSVPAADDRQSDGLVDQEPGRFHGDLARLDRIRGRSTSGSTPRARPGQHWINSQFGEGIITWNTPFLFRTKPAGSRLCLRTGQLLQGQCPPAHRAHRERLDEHVVHDELEAHGARPAGPVRIGEPLFQAIPLVSNVCADLEGASVTYQKLTDDPETVPGLPGVGRGPAAVPRAEARARSSPTTGRRTTSRVATRWARAIGNVAYDQSEGTPDPVQGLPSAASSAGLQLVGDDGPAYGKAAASDGGTVGHPSPGFDQCRGSNR